MNIIEQITALRQQLAQWRQAGQRIALVPTMGALHDGHLSLVQLAFTHAERVVVSVFVNPLQFGPSEDFTRYPRTFANDVAQLTRVGTHLLFAPTVKELYPNGQALHTRVLVPELSTQLCGVTRPAFFDGVATVVTKLFNIVQPDCAVFGEKDYQQLVLIRQLVADLNWPIMIHGAPTVRAADGLALSSRNAYLTPTERAIASQLYAVLKQAATAVRAGIAIDQIEHTAREQLNQHGLRPDYVSIRRAIDLAVPIEGDKSLVILAAVYLGTTRLIDNLTVVRNETDA
ncbi:pantoate--beta-alanine ligase [Thiospirillum jenense]|uniref:Pantothenate synthetase n=1 Tax=Thiospirillum jenense TaxID=1653858 RepID=A0A839HDQ2_9GAMM|nr:pantoate--beta-alanine ligase [Thiospirillum jenense]MBB1125378.1 pantoate--beta-alanine ligase [Thiospirillum jenense]